MSKLTFSGTVIVDDKKRFAVVGIGKHLSKLKICSEPKAAELLSPDLRARKKREVMSVPFKKAKNNGTK